MTSAASHGLYVKHVLEELGYPSEIWLEGDATAAQANASKMAPAKLRHLETSEMFIKEAVRRKLVKLRKVKSCDNVADIHTKHVDAETLARFKADIGFGTVPPSATYRLVKLERVNDFDDLWKAVDAWEQAMGE